MLDFLISSKEYERSRTHSILVPLNKSAHLCKLSLEIMKAPSGMSTTVTLLPWCPSPMPQPHEALHLDSHGFLGANWRTTHLGSIVNFDSSTPYKRQLTYRLDTSTSTPTLGPAGPELWSVSRAKWQPTSVTGTQSYSYWKTKEIQREKGVGEGWIGSLG